MNEHEIEVAAEQWAREKVPDPIRTLSVNKWDLKAGFIAGAKMMKEHLNPEGEKYNAEKTNGKK